MVKVYSFTRHKSHDGYCFGVDVDVSENKEKILALFNVWVKEEKKFAEEKGFQIIVNETGHFESCIFGDYSNNHSQGIISEHWVDLFSHIDFRGLK